MPKKIPQAIEHFTIDNVVYFELLGRAKQDKTLAYVSLDKWPFVSKYRWYLDKRGYPFCYDNGMHLHRLIYSMILDGILPSHIYVDHVDRNKLNNTDENLRPATAQENSFNKSSDNNYKGVRKISDGNFCASITRDGRRHEIKNLSTREQAAEMYNLMAEELFGAFAAPNKIIIATPEIISQHDDIQFIDKQ